MLKIGDVIKWNNCPFRKDLKSKKKPRWWIYLGKRQDGSSLLIMVTATTQTQYYKVGEDRFKNKRISIKKGDFGFNDDCLIDLDIGISYDEIAEAELSEHQADIEPISNIKETRETFMREIYNKICESRKTPLRIKKDIHYSFNLAGITGLKQPKRL